MLKNYCVLSEVLFQPVICIDSKVLLGKCKFLNGLSPDLAGFLKQYSQSWTL